MPALLSDITQGHRLVSLRAGPDALAHSVAYAPGAVMPPHAHARANITLIISGALHESTEDHDYHAAPLSLIIKPSGAQHATTISARALHARVIELTPRLEQALRRDVSWFNRCTRVDSGPLLIATLNFWNSLSAPNLLPANRAAAVDAWLASITAAPPPLDPDQSAAISPALALISRNLADPINARSLADHLHIHPVSVTRQFSRALGCGVMTQLRRMRVRAAADRLAAGLTPIARIAAELGFADQAHLTRSFRRETGLTPALYRRMTAAWN